jgi:hypothetical protein
MGVCRTIIGRSAIALILATAWARPSAAQVTTASVAGVVKDAQGGVIPGATVVLVSERQGTTSAPVVTNGTGDFVFPTVPADTYTIEVSMSGFKTLRRSGIAVSPGDRVAVGALVIEVGGTNEVVDVKADTPLLQAASGERSFTIGSAQIDNLPIASRTYQAFAALTPGVANNSDRLGGGGGNNYMLDGVVVMDPGNGGPALQVNTETIAEVKVLTSGYQAEYGRASGLQITAVTKSGTNQFRGSAYYVGRNSDWDANSRVNVLNGDPKPVVRQGDMGFTIGGPIGKPGGHNKLFFFYAQEWNPRTQGNNVVRYRMPTALERQGDFSQTYDNNGARYPYIKDPLLSGSCNATNQQACFADGGVVGRIPTNRLYSTGLAILNWWPMPNIDGAGLAYNYQIVRPVEKALGYQPVLRVDYQPLPALRIGAKYEAYGERTQTFLGNLPGFTDARPSKPVTPSMMMTANYNLNPTTYIEATFGHSSEQQEGCAFTSTSGSLGPAFCTNSIAQSPLSNYKTAGFGDLPLLFPDALVIDPNYHFYQIFQEMQPPYWDGTRLWRAPTFSWGNRIANAPPNTPYPGYFQNGGTYDFSVSVTKIVGRHTLKAGYYYQSELHNRNGGSGAWNGSLSFAQDTVGTNPYDTSFGYANAAIGSFSSYTQVSKYLAGRFVYHQNEGYVQDNWKLNARLTLDYGVRFVNQQPYYDALKQASNFLPDRYDPSAAPALYVATCANGVAPCSGANRQAMNPLTGEALGPGSSIAIGTLVSGSGDPTNGLVVAGQGIVDTGFKWPAFAAAPRFGLAYDVDGSQRLILRGSFGVFYDRPSANAAGTYNMIGNPPITQTATVRYGQLQTLGSTGLSTVAAPSIQANQYESPLPASVQFNAGVQMVLPWAMRLDASYVGQHAYNQIESVNLNAIDFGTAFLPDAQDPTAAPNATPGAASFAATNQDLVRAFPGYAAITQRFYDGWRTYHSVQLSVVRQFSNGFSFGINDTISLSDTGNAPLRLQHDALGAYSIRADQADAQRLFGSNVPQTHVLKANFVWDLPDLQSDAGAMRIVRLLANDWQLSGIWTGASGPAYTVGFTYQNGGSAVNLTGSPDYAARIRLVGDPGSGCSGDVYRQFNTAAFQGPLPNSVGLESGNDYLHGCFQSVLDLAIARNIKLGGSRSVQLRIDMFNAPNAAIVSGRNTTLSLSSPTDPATALNLPYDAQGNLRSNFSLPKNAGFGVANNYQAARSLQAQIRFSF